MNFYCCLYQSYIIVNITCILSLDIERLSIERNFIYEKNYGFVSTKLLSSIVVSFFFFGPIVFMIL